MIIIIIKMIIIIIIMHLEVINRGNRQVDFEEITKRANGSQHLGEPKITRIGYD
jgi:hypothetical protein